MWAHVGLCLQVNLPEENKRWGIRQMAFWQKPLNCTECETLVPLSSSESSNPKRQHLVLMSPLKVNVFRKAAWTGSCPEPQQSNSLLNTCWLGNSREGDISEVVAVVVLMLPRATRWQKCPILKCCIREKQWKKRVKISIIWWSSKRNKSPWNYLQKLPSWSCAYKETFWRTF